MGVRIDKWLWAARFFKTRSLAHAAVESGKVLIAGFRPKPARDVALGDMVEVRNEGGHYVVQVTGLAEKRGSAEIARSLYAETAQSIAAREAERAKRIQFAEPAIDIFARPTKRDRRSLARFTGKP